MDTARIIAFTSVGFLFAIALQLTARDLESNMQDLNGPPKKDVATQVIWVDGEPVETVRPELRRGASKTTFETAMEQRQPIQDRRDARTGSPSSFKTYETALLEARIRGGGR